MPTTYSKLNSTLLTFSLLLAIFFIEDLNGQNRVTLNTSIGHTFVDLESWSGEGAMEDWNQMMYEGYVQYYFYRLGQVNVGVEVGFQHFFWYEYTVLHGLDIIYYDYDTKAGRILAIVYKDFGKNLFSEFGLGHYMFDGFSDFGMIGSFGYIMEVNNHLSVPIKLRTSIVFESDSNLAILGLSIGIMYSL